MSKLVDKNGANPFEMQMQPEEQKQPNKKSFFSAVKRLLSYIFIDGMSGMAVGLFATLIIGTIIENIGKAFGDNAFGESVRLAGQFAKFLMGAGIALGMGYKLKKSPLVSISAGVVGMLASFVAAIGAGKTVSFTSVGEPLGTFIAAFVALEVGSLERKNQGGHYRHPSRFYCGGRARSLFNRNAHFRIYGAFERPHSDGGRAAAILDGNFRGGAYGGILDLAHFLGGDWRNAWLGRYRGGRGGGRLLLPNGRLRRDELSGKQMGRTACAGLGNEYAANAQPRQEADFVVAARDCQRNFRSDCHLRV